MLFNSVKVLCGFLIPFPVMAQVAAVHLTAHVPVTQKNVFVAGNFNHWTPGDSLYRMNKLNDSTYTLTLPVYKNVPYQYKYTLGSWNQVEIASNDSNISNRSFIAAKRKRKISDTVMKWQVPKTAGQQNLNPQMQKIMAMKDSVLAGLQPRLNEMLQLLKEYATNLLQEHPSAAVDQKITDEVIQRFSNVQQKLNELCHKIFETLSPEQKQKILKAINDPKASKDFINTLMGAMNEAVSAMPKS